MDTGAQCMKGYGFGHFVLDRRDERLIGPNGPVRLGNKAFQVLLRLLEQDGRLVTKDDLFSSVWDGTIVSEFALTSVIKELRRALGDHARPPLFIATVYGRGYRWLCPVAAVDCPTPREIVGEATGATPPPAAKLSAPCKPLPQVGRLLKGAVGAILIGTSVLAIVPARLGGGAAAVEGPSGSPVRAADLPTLAVLPFADLSAEGKGSSLAAGVQEEVIGSLAGEQRLRVAGRTIGAQLGAGTGRGDLRGGVGVTHLLEGSVRAVGPTVRVNVRMLRADDRTQLWAERIDLAAGDRLAVQDSIGELVATRIRARFQQVPRT